MRIAHRLTSYDKDNVSERIIETLESKYIDHELFTLDLAQKANPAAESLCQWVHALCLYNKVRIWHNLTNNTGQGKAALCLGKRYLDCFQNTSTFHNNKLVGTFITVHIDCMLMGLMDLYRSDGKPNKKQQYPILFA